jgi:hypothetical protein
MVIVNVSTGFTPFSQYGREAKERAARYKAAGVTATVPVMPVPSSTIVEISQQARQLLAAEQTSRLSWDWDI